MTTYLKLCSKCIEDAEKKRGHRITDEVDCENCEGLEGCIHWLWGDIKPKDTKQRAGGCPYFARVGLHRFKTCQRGL